ncbi:DUF397 domain-containing protein [Streptomyces sp. NBC_00658]|uniref:DUF397 domain-containing protein n=1 Tax=Streptomyces sp. NBC_00658 TaxID=2975800 RepID=UPI0032469C3C
MTDRTILNSAELQGWRKSSYSNSEGGSCVEVFDGYPSGVPVRDSKEPFGPALVFSAASWSAFVVTAKAGDLRF